MNLALQSPNCPKTKAVVVTQRSRGLGPEYHQEGDAGRGGRGHPLVHRVQERLGHPQERQLGRRLRQEEAEGVRGTRGLPTLPGQASHLVSYT